MSAWEPAACSENWRSGAALGRRDGARCSFCFSIFLVVRYCRMERVDRDELMLRVPVPRLRVSCDVHFQIASCLFSTPWPLQRRLGSAFALQKENAKEQVAMACPHLPIQSEFPDYDYELDYWASRRGFRGARQGLSWEIGRCVTFTEIEVFFWLPGRFHFPFLGSLTVCSVRGL